MQRQESVCEAVQGKWTGGKEEETGYVGAGNPAGLGQWKLPSNPKQATQSRIVTPGTPTVCPKMGGNTARRLGLVSLPLSHFGKRHDPYTKENQWQETRQFHLQTPTGPEESDQENKDNGIRTSTEQLAPEVELITFEQDSQLVPQEREGDDKAAPRKSYPGSMDNSFRGEADWTVRPAPPSPEGQVDAKKKVDPRIQEIKERTPAMASQCQNANLGRLMSMYYLNSFGADDDEGWNIL